MNVIEVEPIDTPGLPGSPNIAHHLLAVVLERGQGVLWSEYIRGRGGATVFLRPRLEVDEREDIYSILPEGMFRAVLADFAFRYIDKELYGGYSRKTLSYRGKLFQASFWMANDLAHGFWFRISVQPA